MFFSCLPVQAQLINYERRAKREKAKLLRQNVSTRILNKNSEVKPQAAVQDAKRSASKDIEGSSSPENTAEIVLSKLKVSNRVERIYDGDNNGLLEKSEIKAFLKDVVSSVERRGKFKVTSDILKNFDTDQDGKINRVELGRIQSYIY